MSDFTKLGRGWALAVGLVVVGGVVLPLGLDAWGSFCERTAANRGAARHREDARALLLARDFTQAELALRAAIDLTPRDPDVRHELMQLQANWVAATPEKLGTGDLEAFRYTLDVLGAYDGTATDAAVYVAAGHVAQRREGSARALELYEKGIATDAKNVEAWLAKGATLRAAGKMDDSAKAYEAAFAVEPNNVTVANNLGVQYVDMGRLDDGIGMFQRAIAVKDNPASQINLGNAMLLKNQPEASLGNFKRATELSPASAESWRRFGAALYQNKRFADAVTALRKSLELEQDPVTTMNLAQTYQALGRHDAAVVLLRQTLQARPDADQAVYHLGVSLEALGEKSEAIASYERFVRSPKVVADTKNAMALQARDRLVALRGK